MFQQTVGFICTSWQAFCHFAPQSHRHTCAAWIINTELDLVPLRKSHRVQQCLNNSAAVTGQADATQASNRDEVRVEKTALGKATNNIFTEQCQGAECVSSGSFLLFMYCSMFFC